MLVYIRYHTAVLQVLEHVYMVHSDILWGAYTGDRFIHYKKKHT